MVDQYSFESGCGDDLLRLVRLSLPPAFPRGGAFPTRGELNRVNVQHGWESRMKKIKNVVVCLFVALLLAPRSDAKAQDQPFYQGQSIKIIVGFTSGGFYDRWSRLLARYAPKYIPGNPEMIVQNMPGAGGLIAANHMYSVAKPDGSR
jgi:hypothetical protein